MGAALSGGAGQWCATPQSRACTSTPATVLVPHWLQPPDPPSCPIFHPDSPHHTLAPGCSIAYMGPAAGRAAAADGAMPPVRDNTLRRLFAKDPGALTDMLASLAQSGVSH